MSLPLVLAAVLMAASSPGVSTRRVLGSRRGLATGGFTTNREPVLFALVANRAIEPMSKLSTAEWVSEDVVIPRLGRDG